MPIALHFITKPVVPHTAVHTQELHMVCEKVNPSMPALVEALDSYHLHSPDGWIQTAG